jgi:hypothetical protein
MKYGIKVNRPEVGYSETTRNWRAEYLIVIEDDNSSHLYYKDDYVSNNNRPLASMPNPVSYDSRADVYLTVNFSDKTIDISRDFISWTKWRPIPARLLGPQYLYSLGIRMQAFFNTSTHELEIYEMPLWEIQSKYYLNADNLLGIQLMDHDVAVLYRDKKEGQYGVRETQDSPLVEIDSSGFNFLSSVSQETDLPKSDNNIYDVIQVAGTGQLFIWLGGPNWSFLDYCFFTNIDSSQQSLIRPVRGFEIAGFYSDKTVITKLTDPVRTDILPRIKYFDYLYPEPFSINPPRRAQFYTTDVPYSALSLQEKINQLSPLTCGYGVEYIYSPPNPTYKLTTTVTTTTTQPVTVTTTSTTIPSIPDELGRVYLTILDHTVTLSLTQTLNYTDVSTPFQNTLSTPTTPVVISVDTNNAQGLGYNIQGIASVAAGSLKYLQTPLTTKALNIYSVPSFTDPALPGFIEADLLELEIDGVTYSFSLTEDDGLADLNNDILLATGLPIVFTLHPNFVGLGDLFDINPSVYPYVLQLSTPEKMSPSSVTVLSSSTSTVLHQLGYDISLPETTTITTAELTFLGNHRKPRYLGVWSTGVKSLIPIEYDTGKTVLDDQINAYNYLILTKLNHLEVFTDDGIRLAHHADNHTHTQYLLWHEAIGTDVTRHTYSVTVTVENIRPDTPTITTTTVLPANTDVLGRVYLSTLGELTVSTDTTPTFVTVESPKYSDVKTTSIPLFTHVGPGTSLIKDGVISTIPNQDGYPGEIELQSTILLPDLVNHPDRPQGEQLIGANDGDHFDVRFDNIDFSIPMFSRMTFRQLQLDFTRITKTAVLHGVEEHYPLHQISIEALTVNIMSMQIMSSSTLNALQILGYPTPKVFEDRRTAVLTKTEHKTSTLSIRQQDYFDEIFLRTMEFKKVDEV